MDSGGLRVARRSQQQLHYFRLDCVTLQVKSNGGPLGSGVQQYMGGLPPSRRIQQPEEPRSKHKGNDGVHASCRILLQEAAQGGQVQDARRVCQEWMMLYTELGNPLLVI